MSIAEIRKRAWVTRRAKYGQAGHSAAYSRPRRHDGLLALVIRLHVEGVLSEGQVAKAAGLDRVEIRRLADELELTPHHPASISQR